MENYKVTIDRLTICGNIEGDVEGFYKNSQAVINYGLAKYPYRHQVQLQDGSLLQVAEKECVNSGKLKELRYDFNPNNSTYNVLHSEVLKLMKDGHCTRIDVAFDVYGVDMSGWRWVDSKGRPFNVYYSGTGEVETWYVGGKDSELRVRIYNKAKEQKLKDKVWWRVEVQMRRSKANLYVMGKEPLENPFESIVPVCKGNYEGLKISERALLSYLVDNIQSFGEMDRKTRSKYRKMLSDNSKANIDLVAIWNDTYDFGKSEIASWLNYIRVI